MNFHKIVFLSAIFIILIPYTSDGDFWLHLRMGEILVEDGTFPRTDVLSFTNEGKEWINHEWLPQAIFYLLFKYGGFLAVALFTALLGTLLFALLIWRRKFSLFLVLFLFLVAFSIKPFIVPRPQIFAYLMLLGLVLVVGRYHSTGNKKALYLVPLILFLWANIHASVILALPVLFFTIVLGKDRKPLLIFSLLAVGLTLVNPFGYKIYWQALQPLRFSGAYHALLETQPIYKVVYEPILLITHLVIILSAFWHVFKKRLSILRPYELATLGLFLAMPFVAVKYVPYSWAATLPILLKIIPHFKTQQARLVITSLACWVVIIASAVLFFRDGNLFKDPHDEWPKEMVNFINDNNINGNMYNPYSWSGYLAWENKKPVFINGALASLGGDVFWDGLDFEKGERVEEIINKYNLSVIISQPWIVLPYSISLKDDWSLVYWDNFGVIFLRRGFGSDEIIEKYGLDITYFNDSVESVLKKYKTDEVPGLIENYKKAIERHPNLLLGRYRLGLIYKLLGHCSKAIEHFKEIIAIDQGLASAHYRLAECYQDMGDFKSAVYEKELAGKFKGREVWWKGRR